MTVPEIRRELIRLCNRDGLNGTEVTAVLECAEWMLQRLELEPEPYSADEAARVILDMWKESFDAEP